MSTNQFNRQEVLSAMVDLGVANIGAGKGYTAVIPRGALVVGVGLYTVTAFNSGTTATGTITDGTTAFVNAQDEPVPASKLWPLRRSSTQMAGRSSSTLPKPALRPPQAAPSGTCPISSLAVATTFRSNPVPAARIAGSPFYSTPENVRCNSDPPTATPSLLAPRWAIRPS